MAMKIGSKYKFVEVMPRHWDLFAESAGLAKAETRKRVLQLATALPPLAKKLESDQTFSGNVTIEKIIALLEKRCTTTTQRLALSGNLEAEA
jgi:serine/threonine-protein kinase HipA